MLRNISKIKIACIHRFYPAECLSRQMDSSYFVDCFFAALNVVTHSGIHIPPWRKTTITANLSSQRMSYISFFNEYILPQKVLDFLEHRAPR